jgi:hypothetical protein
VLAIPAAAYAAPSLAPWGWHGRVSGYEVYAETPPDSALHGELARAEQLLATSPLDDARVRPTLFLTDGGWRWRFYTLNSGAFAVTRQLLGQSIVNRSDIAADLVFARDRQRHLSGVIAHETTHMLVRHHVGMLAAMRMPAWVREGYAEHVAQETTLQDDEVAAMRYQGSKDPAIFYHAARKRVEAALFRGVSIDELLAGRES